MVLLLLQVGKVIREGMPSASEADEVLGGRAAAMKTCKGCDWCDAPGAAFAGCGADRSHYFLKK